MSQVTISLTDIAVQCLETGDRYHQQEYVLVSTAYDKVLARCVDLLFVFGDSMMSFAIYLVMYLRFAHERFKCWTQIGIRVRISKFFHFFFSSFSKF